MDEKVFNVLFEYSTYGIVIFLVESLSEVRKERRFFCRQKVTDQPYFQIKVMFNKDENNEEL